MMIYDVTQAHANRHNTHTCKGKQRKKSHDLEENDPLTQVPVLYFLTNNSTKQKQKIKK